MSQPWIPTGGRTGLQTHIAATESVSWVRADEKLTAFLELEAALRGRACGQTYDESAVESPIDTSLAVFYSRPLSPAQDVLTIFPFGKISEDFGRQIPK